MCDSFWGLLMAKAIYWLGHHQSNQKRMNHGILYVAYMKIEIIDGNPVMKAICPKNRSLQD